MATPEKEEAARLPVCSSYGTPNEVRHDVEILCHQVDEQIEADRSRVLSIVPIESNPVWVNR